MRVAFRRWWRETLRAGLDVLLPSSCPGCGSGADGVCPRCRPLLERPPTPADPCPRCGAPLRDGQCSDPQAHRSIAGLRWVVARWSYRGAGGSAVRRWKFQGDVVAMRWLTMGMVAAARGHPHAPWRRARVVPVPSHPRKRRERGRDHTGVLAREIVAMVPGEWRWSTEVGALARRIVTRPQGDPRVTSREENVSGVFAAARPDAIVGQRIVLVDDVMTSGATARECARVLLAAGAAEVGLMVACRSRAREASAVPQSGA